ncbi:MAG TPA: NAD(P)H-dependent glycerol-3-phosphate dehydrogenase [bacterium]|nr:NAD(P)H-dependent glycerol-3-phosphate dehydrogenase [bacterium]
MKRAFVLGGGGWGSALALVLSERFERVDVWEHEAAYALEVESLRENRRYLPGVRLPDAVHMGSDLAALSGADLLVLSVPSAFFRAVWSRALIHGDPSQVAVVATKGIEPGSLMTMRQVAQDECAKAGRPAPRLATLSGPSHAEEVGRRLPATLVAASLDHETAQLAQKAFSNDWFRVYTSADPLGVEIGGALKNVVALAAGVSDGLGLGDNAKAALITRGLAEISRLGLAMGAQAATFHGLTGLGDLVVTCMSRHSRNRGVGERLGRGERWSGISPTFHQAVEGVVTSASTLDLSRRHGVALPIAEQVNAILFQDKDPRAALKDLMARPLKDED